MVKSVRTNLSTFEFTVAAHVLNHIKSPNVRVFPLGDVWKVTHDMQRHLEFLYILKTRVNTCSVYQRIISADRLHMTQADQNNAEQIRSTLELSCCLHSRFALPVFFFSFWGVRKGLVFCNPN